MKKTFEDFLMEKHAEDYVGIKGTMVDDCADWMEDLDLDDFLKYGDLFAKEQSKGLLEALKNLINAYKYKDDEYENNRFDATIKAEQAIAKAE